MEPRFDPIPIVLEGTAVRVEPLDLRHAPALLGAASDRSIFRYMPTRGFDSLDDVREWIDGAVGRAAGGAEIPFAIVDVREGRAVGSTRYLDIRREHRALEIGWTWLGRAWQRTAVNTECKYLLFRHAFDTLGAVRVQLKTDLRNEQSQRAIERIGAVREGVLRQSMIMPDGYLRDSVYYSIIAPEWPAVKAAIEATLGAGARAH